MAFSVIDGGNDVSKISGDKVSLIDTAALLSLSFISTDPNFDSENKWDTVIVVYTHTSGQKKVIVHKLKDGEWRGILKVDNAMNSGIWEKRLVAIFDRCNDSVVVDRENIVALEEDLNVI